MFNEENTVITNDNEWIVKVQSSNNGVSTNIRVAIPCLPSGSEFEETINNILKEAKEAFNNETNHIQKLYPTSD